MRGPSDLAKRLADDLVEVGKMFGFEAKKEYPVLKESKLRVDVFWKLKSSKGSFFSDINIASIEIQYSPSTSSISNNIFKAEKTLHPAFHFVISYFKLSDDYKKVLKSHFPHSGLKIIEGDTEVRNLNLWITKFVTNKDEERKLADTGKKMEEFAKTQQAVTKPSEIEQQFREKFHTEIEEVVTPKEVNNLMKAFADFEEKKSSFQYVDKVFNRFTRFVQEKLRKHNIPSINFSASLLFGSIFTSDTSQPLDEGIRLKNKIMIEPNGVFIEDTYFNRYSIRFRGGNGSIETSTDDPISIWKERIDAKRILHFVSKASDIIADQIQNLEISEEEMKKMKAVIKALSPTY